MSGVMPIETSGGWGSLDNILAGIGKGADFVSDFFPATQYSTIRSETTLAAGGTGQTFRPTTQENQSMIDTAVMALRGWIGTPYEDNMAIPVKVAESKGLAKTVETKDDPIGQGLDWALNITKKAGQLYDQVKETFSPREVISETPRAGYPEGRDVMHTNETVNRGAEVIEKGKAIYEQVKGLFGLGYEPAEKQPVPAVTHELSAGIGIGTIAVAAVLIYLLVK